MPDQFDDVFRARLNHRVEAVRQVWNNFVFSRVGLPPGVQMRVVPEQDAYNDLSEAMGAFFTEWDAQ
ncbi:MAG TPA: hypothetical protein VG476_12605 [Acidimicrobiales bacterium]|nr:hypothetical protein [Acidimicrobiales bacterium]